MTVLVGTQPDQISVNGMLGDLAFQSSASLFVNRLAAGSSAAANFTRFPNAISVFSTNIISANNETYNIGVVGEGVADSGTGTNWGVGVYGVGYTSNNSSSTVRSAGVIGESHVTSSTDNLNAIGVRSYSNDTHTGGFNIGLYSEAQNSTTGNYALFMNAGNIYSNVGQVWTLAGGNLTFAGSTYSCITTKAPSTINASTYTVATNDSSLIFTTTNCTITLPTASANSGRILYVKNITATTVISNATNVYPIGSGTLSTSILSATAGKFAMLQSDGTNWVIMMSN